MKKIVYLIVFVFISFVLLKFYNMNTEERKFEKTKIVKVKTVKKIVAKQKTLYVSLVPKINQDYTINYLNDETSNKQSNIMVTNNEMDLTITKEDDLENNVENKYDKEDEIEENKSDFTLDEVDSTSTIHDKKDQDYINENTEEKTSVLKNGFYEENSNTYYYDNDVKVTGIKNINGVNNYFSPSGKYLGTNNIKVIDVSYYQKDVNWDEFKEKSDCYGVILRLGYYDTLDKKFERNITELKRLNIPYGIYLFSYATTLNGAKKEALFTQNMISKFDLNPTLGIYYDIESWSTKTSNSNGITKSKYDEIIQYYVNSISNFINYKYKVKVYSNRWYAMNRLGALSKKYVDWVAEYNSTCKYDDIYSIWQYTSKGSVPGINGNVDLSYILN